MKRYEVSTEARRLTGCLERRGVQTGFSSAGAWLFGLPFVGMGVYIVLVGSRVVAVNPGRVHAPYWVLTLAGTVFAVAGLLVWSMAWRQSAANARSRRRATELRDEPALLDYPWDPQGCAAPRWSRAVKAVSGAAFLSLFLALFNYWAWFVPNAPWLLKAIVVLFDLILVAVWWRALVLVGRALKFGGSQVVFKRFPYRVEEPIGLQWQPTTGIDKPARGTFTLRCVHEWLEQHGRGKDRTSHVVHEQLWSGTWHLEAGESLPPGMLLDLYYEPPAQARATELSAVQPVFWELDVHLDLPGLDFKEKYLVPVYGTRPSTDTAISDAGGAPTAQSVTRPS